MFTEVFAPVNFPVDGPEIGPLIIFKDLTPIYMKVNFHKWCEIALAEVGASRQLEARVITYMQKEFMGLINAFYCISVLMKDNFEDKEAIRTQFQEYRNTYYIKDVKEEDFLPPFDFCQAFFAGITLKSARSINWLLMEVVSANKDKYEYKVEEKHILTLFERYNAILKLTDEWQKALKKPGAPGIKKKARPKSSRKK